MLDAAEVSEALYARQQAEKVLTTWGSIRTTYNDWHSELETVLNIYAGRWDVVWPDNVITRSLPKTPNWLQLAADDRARAVGAANPAQRCRPAKPADDAKIAAEKRERILGGYWEGSRVRLQTPRWAHDAMASGFTACLVLADTSKPIAERFPVYKRLEPALCYPDPVFTDGPFCDSFIYAYEDTARTVELRYGLEPGQLSGFKDPRTSQAKVRVISYWDSEDMVIVAEPVSIGPRRKTRTELIVAEKHLMGRCPVAIGARPSMDGTYRGEFFGGLGVLNLLNRLYTLTLDDATYKVYPARIDFDIENPEDWGPDATLHAQSRDARMEFVQPPNAPFTNIQLMRDLAGFARAQFILPPSRSGDPNESIISAAGISASQSQFNSDVQAIELDVLAPMLQAANELAFKADEVWCDATKTIYGTGPKGSYTETYKPSKDIAGQHRNEVVYGPGSGLDEINTNVMVIQQLDAGLIDRDTAMELSPFVQDPGAVSKRRVLQTLDDALLSGLITQAAQGQLLASDLAHIRQMAEDTSTPLHEIIAMHAPLMAAPLAAPSPEEGLAEAPGIAGAQEAQTASNLPPLAQVLGAA